MNFSSLFHLDQLTLQKELQDNFLQKFQEGTITFPPTYKLGNSVPTQVSKRENTAKKEFQAGLIASSTAKKEKFTERATNAPMN